MRYLVIGLLLISCLGMAEAATPEELADLKSDCQRALADLGLTYRDLRIRSDYAKPDVFRLPVVDSLMADPGTLPARINRLADDVECESLIAEIAHSQEYCWQLRSSAI